MFKQSVSIIECSKLYNILFEIKEIFSFNIYNYHNLKDFISKIENNNMESINSLIIVDKNDNKLLSHKKINRNNILFCDEFPIRIEKFLDRINTQLIQKKYNFQSKIEIKKYILNLNSRVISFKKKELKLTEREIDIILFLNNNSEQSVEKLQNEVWRYSLGLETHTVETHIYRLRKKIKDQFDDENFILSYDNGYKI
jgi:hypothetical protein